MYSRSSAYSTGSYTSANMSGGHSSNNTSMNYNNSSNNTSYPYVHQSILNSANGNPYASSGSHMALEEEERTPNALCQACKFVKDKCSDAWSTTMAKCMEPLSHRFLSSDVWRVTLFLANLVLLFGSIVQMLWLPKEADPYCDAVYFLVFLIFLCDICFRTTLVPGYFKCYVSQWGGDHYSNHHRHHHHHNADMDESSAGHHHLSSPTNSASNNNNKARKGACGFLACEQCFYDWCRWVHVGSFLFWCDALSMCTLFWDISYTNSSSFELVEWKLDLSQTGTPDSTDRMSLFRLNEANPWSFNGPLLITILRTARIVRFVRSHAVSSLISKVNWYYPLQKLYALSQKLNCCSVMRDILWQNHTRYSSNYYDAMDSSNPNNNLDDGPMGSSSAGGAGGSGVSGTATRDYTRQRAGGVGGDGRDRNDPLGSSKTSNAASLGEERRSSWAGLGLSTLAAVKAQRMAHEAESSQNNGKWGKFVRMLRSAGILGKDETEFQRHLAATKIQRAWRRATAARHYESDRFMDEMGMLHGSRGQRMRSNGSKNKLASWKKTSLANMEEEDGRKHGRLGVPKSLRKMSIYQGIESSTARISKNLKLSGGGEQAEESQVGGAMRELTGQRVAIGILVALLLTATFTYVENDPTRPSTMIILHSQTTGTRYSPDMSTFVTTPPPQAWQETALEAARIASIPDLYRFDFASGNEKNYEVTGSEELRDREKLKIVVASINNTDPQRPLMESVGWFANREQRKNEAYVQLFSTIFILLLWLFGVTAFAGPVMVLVVLPIERMVRLLGMLMVDPLGYQSTSRYRRFVAEEDEITKNTRWTKEVLKGMETSFLMSTILRIGSLMKVGFGSAGVEIIRKNLEVKAGGNANLLTVKGLSVSCIFLFCDIRQFTDATECLQEEVFVFTNRIAAVVHSFCHSYGGSANKNVGDAFLCSWLLDAPPNDGGFGGGDKLYAKSNQADKCLLCVVKICMALHHDSYYIETMSEAPRQRLLAKLKKRPGPVVQMGCGLHAGKAVQGAIGSERKIDATYVSEAVEMAEFLESSTKKYGLKMLMSNAFHDLLGPNNRQRCRLVDQIVLPNEDEDEDDMAGIMYERDDILELYTYDMDIDALWKAPPMPLSAKNTQDKSSMDGGSLSEGTESRHGVSDRRGDMKKTASSQRPPGSSRVRGERRRMSLAGMLTSKSALNASKTSDNSKQQQLEGSTHDWSSVDHNSSALKANPGSTANMGDGKEGGNHPEFRKPELILPTGPALYNPTIWRSEQMFRIRKKYLDGLFFHNYSQGLQSFYHRDWERAKQSFKAILDSFEDGPSRYFLNQIEKLGKPPPNFRPYGIA